MKIDPLKPMDVGSPVRSPAKAPASAAGQSAKPADVQLSSASTELAAQEPAVNLARVQEIRQAISEGRFEVNASAIADRLITTARELVGTRPQA